MKFLKQFRSDWEDFDTTERLTIVAMIVFIFFLLSVLGLATYSIFS